MALGAIQIDKILKDVYLPAFKREDGVGYVNFLWRGEKCECPVCEGVWLVPDPSTNEIYCPSCLVKFGMHEMHSHHDLPVSVMFDQILSERAYGRSETRAS
jgi:hypothetical protein